MQDGLIGGPAVIALVHGRPSEGRRSRHPNRSCADPTPPDPTELRGAEPFEFATELRRRWLAIRGIPFQRPHDGGLETRRQVGPELARRPWVDAKAFEGHRGRRRPIEWPHAGQCLVEDDAERVDIRPRRDGLARDLLRAGVLGRPQDRPRGRRPGVGRGAGDPEVGHACLAVVVDQDVRGLDVAVHDAVLVGELERPRGLDADAHGEPEWQLAVSGDDLLQVRAVDQAHDDEVAAHLVGAGVMDRDDVRVEERGRVPRLPPESLDERVILRIRRSKDLDGHLPCQHLVLCPIHDGHTALAEDLEQAIAAGEHTSRHRHPPIQGHRCVAARLHPGPERHDGVASR